MTSATSAASTETRPNIILDRLADKASDVFVDAPLRCCGGCAVFLVLLTGLSMGLNCMGLTEQETAWRIHTGQAQKWLAAYDMAQGQAEDGGGRRRLQEEGGTDESLMLMYKSDNLLTPQRLRDVCLVEREAIRQIHERSGCPGGEDCSPYDSLTRIFYGTGSIPLDRVLSPSLDCQELTQASIDETRGMISSSVAAEGVKSPYAKFVDSDFQSTNVVKLSKSNFYMSTDEGQAVMDDIWGQFDPPREYGMFVSPFMGEKEDGFAELHSLQIRYYFTGNDEMGNMVGPDFMLAGVSVLTVFGILYLYMGCSFILACAGMFQIVLSLPIGSLIYRKVLQIQYFNFLHILVIYLVLGIGADDIFVLVDTFKHISAESPLKDAGTAYNRDDLKAVVRATFRRTSSAIFNTSFTTFVAFMSCSVSKCMPMRTCGWYAAICIVLCYIFTITFMPAVVVIWHQREQNKSCKRCCPPSLKPLGEIQEMQEAKEGEREQGAPVNFIDKVIDRYYVPMMSRKIGCIRPVPLFCVVVMTACSAQGVYFSSKLEPPKEPERWFPTGHMFNDIFEFMTSSFLSSDYDKYTTVSYFWGIEDYNLDGLNSFKPDEFEGKVIFDNSFDLSTAESQQAMLDLCADMQNVACTEEACSNGKLMLQSSDKAYTCFLEDFKQWLGSESMPTGSAFVPKLIEFRNSADGSSYSSEVCHANYWRDIGIIDGQLKYVAVKFRSSLPKDEPLGRGVKVRDVVVDFADTFKATAPSGLKGIKYTGEGTFTQFAFGEELVNGLFAGISIAGPVVFVVLLMSTMNIVLAIYAILAVGSIVLCVLGFCKSAMGWGLGVGEAIAGVIVIGYSVDYVVHLAHIYSEAGHKGITTRDKRAEYAVRNMGSTVFGGALTTAVSGAVMFFCFVTFFPKMAVLMCVTIMYSFLYALGFFMGLVWLIGPEGKCGDLCAPRECLLPKSKEVAAEKGTGETVTGNA
jgi:hypothetical protein